MWQSSGTHGFCAARVAASGSSPITISGGAGGTALTYPLLDCDPMVPEFCGYPFPSNVYSTEDDTTATGRRVSFGDELLRGKFRAHHFDRFGRRFVRHLHTHAAQHLTCIVVVGIELERPFHDRAAVFLAGHRPEVHGAEAERAHPHAGAA